MLVVISELVLAAWLLVSAFALEQTPLSATVVVLAALCVGAVAWASVQRPSLRFVNTAVTLLLALCSAVLPGLSAAARIDTAVVALLLLALSAFVPRHGAAHTVGPPGSAGAPHP
jgi:hypothetical protein